MSSLAPATLGKVRWPHWLIVTIFLAPLAAGIVLPEVAQPEKYQRFVDTRACFGVPNCLDVISNAPLVLLGALGLLALSGTRVARRFIDPRERTIYAALFVATALAGFGSAYFHWAPDPWRLVWDRLPLAALFMCLLAATIAERVDARSGVRWLAPLLALGVGSVLYWRWGLLQGGGNLLPYGIVQYGGIAAIFALALRPSRYTRGHDIFAVGAWYAAAKFGEVFDREIFALTGFVSGHTLKHLFAALAIYWVLRSLYLRRPLHAK